MEDASGQLLSTDFEVLLYGAKVVSDNRIGPKEERLEHFVFPAPRSESFKISATVSYVYAPMILDKTRIQVRLATAETWVR